MVKNPADEYLFRVTIQRVYFFIFFPALWVFFSLLGRWFCHLGVVFQVQPGSFVARYLSGGLTWKPASGVS